MTVSSKRRTDAAAFLRGFLGLKLSAAQRKVLRRLGTPSVPDLIVKRFYGINQHGTILRISVDNSPQLQGVNADMIIIDEAPTQEVTDHLQKATKSLQKALPSIAQLGDAMTNLAKAGKPARHRQRSGVQFKGNTKP
jgi:hypothetical protein